MNVLESRFFSGHGHIALDSLMIALNDVTSDEMRELYETYGRGSQIFYEDIDWKTTPNRDRVLLLTEQHEFDHFTILTSTPIGALLFRVHQAIARDIGFFGRTFRRYGRPIRLSEIAKLGLRRWVEDVGLPHIASTKQSQEEPKFWEYLRREVIPGYENSQRLLQILTSPNPSHEYQGLTRGDFAQLLTDCFDYLARRSDAELVCGRWRGGWTAYRPDELMFPLNAPLNVRVACELLAYTRERQIAKKMGAQRSDLKQLAKSVPVVYRQLLRKWLMNFQQDETLLRQILLESLLGRTDVCALSEKPQLEDFDHQFRSMAQSVWQADLPFGDHRHVLYIEDEWPPFRAMRLHDRGMRSQIRIALTLGSLCKRERLFGEESRWNDSGPIARHLLKINDSLLTNLQLRHKSTLGTLVGKLPAGSSRYTKQLLGLVTKDTITAIGTAYYDFESLYDAQVYAVAMSFMLAAADGTCGAAQVEAYLTALVDFMRPVVRERFEALVDLGRELAASAHSEEVNETLAQLLSQQGPLESLISRLFSPETLEQVSSISVV